MDVSRSDALVFFGASRDLAYKKIFPSLQAMIKHGHFNVTVTAVAWAGWNIDQLRARTRDSIEKHGGEGFATSRLGEPDGVYLNEMKGFLKHVFSIRKEKTCELGLPPITADLI
jgi:hypothetical protein